LIEAAMVEADRGGLSEEEQILVLELIVRSKREDLVPPVIDSAANL
jgi:hypothetical protein